MLEMTTRQIGCRDRRTSRWTAEDLEEVKTMPPGLAKC
jgi:hypothetical protein